MRGCRALLIGGCRALLIGGCRALLIGECRALLIGGCRALLMTCIERGDGVWSSVDRIQVYFDRKKGSFNSS